MPKAAKAAPRKPRNGLACDKATGKPFATVRDYRAKNHEGFVMRFDMPDLAEWGILSPYDVFVEDAAAYAAHKARMEKELAGAK